MLALTSFGGLPAHPLFAHVPIVLVPLGAIGAVAMCRPRIRARIGWVVVGVVFVAGVFAQLTIEAGESLEEYVRETALVEEHVEMGESIRPWLLLMGLSLLGVMIVAEVMRRRGSSSAGSAASGDDEVVATAATAAPARREPLAIVLAVLLAAGVVFSGVSTWSVVRIGHSGAKATWSETEKRIDADQRVGGEGGERDDRDDRDDD